MKPTEEQAEARDLAVSGKNVAIEALAGAGKTTTLRLIADAMDDVTEGRGAYLAFNRKIVDDARVSFRRNRVKVSTLHAMAWGQTGKRYAGRMEGRRVPTWEMSRNLGIEDSPPWLFDRYDESIEIHPTQQTGLAVRTVEAFCTTPDPVLSSLHVPFTRGLDEKESSTNQLELADRIVPLARQIWSELQEEDGGRFRFSHSHYLKMWQLGHPRIEAEYILFDEAQDANPLMLDVIRRQDHAQKIYVGDTNQQIYGWNGAVNALASADVDVRTTLSQSFRFGPEIAEQANIVLERIGSKQRVIGSGPAGRVGELVHPDVWLSRTNAGVVETALGEMAKGKRVCIQGGSKEIVYFAESALRLQQGQRCEHPELAMFSSWAKVVEYVNEDDLGKDLKLLAGLVDEYGAQTIISAFSEAVEESVADVTVSTSHKAKGAEWDRVALIGDFPEADSEPGPEELRLLYVAITRAQRYLDVTAVDVADPNARARRARSPLVADRS